MTLDHLVGRRKRPRARTFLRRGVVETLATHVFLLGICALTIYPVLWIVGLSLSRTEDATRRILPIPGSPSLTNYGELFQAPNFLLQLVNSVAVAAGTSVVAVAIAAPAAYAISRFAFVGRDRALRTLLLSQMFPGVLAAVPLYILLSAVGLYDSLVGLALVYGTTAVPFAIFQLRAAFDGVPPELEEAALLDGATRFGAFWRVALPAARPAIAVTVLFAFMAAWNEFILAATFLSTDALFTMPVVLQRYVGEHHADWPTFAAGAVVASVPVMILFYIAQRHLVQGLGAGAVKG